MPGIDLAAEEVLTSELAGQNEKVRKKLLLRNKVQSVGRMSKMLTYMRENKESLLQLKNMSPDGRLPRGMLLEQLPII